MWPIRFYWNFSTINLRQFQGRKKPGPIAWASKFCSWGSANGSCLVVRSASEISLSGIVSEMSKPRVESMGSFKIQAYLIRQYLVHVYDIADKA